MTQPAFETQLKLLWQQNAREFALAFLREAIHAQLTLAELEAVLACDTIKDQIGRINLGEVLGASPPAATQAAPSRPTPPPTRGSPRGPRRPRPSQEKMQQAVVRALQENRDGLTTPKISEHLLGEMPDIDPARTIAVLRHLEVGGQVVGDRSRPRRWQLKNPGRRIPEPIIIRKAAVVQAEAAAAAVKATPEATRMVEAPAPVNGGGPTSILSQAEIQRAAKQLHERFFATNKSP